MIEARGIEKRFGPKRVVRDVSFSLARGSTLLVTGPNGAGKTTLLRMLAGLTAPTGGTLEIDADRSDVGYLGHEALVYRDLTAVENLGLYARLYRVPQGHARVAELLERFGLAQARDVRVGAFSRGMTQRLALCRALLHTPSLLVLDEPHTALDADGAALLDEQLAAIVGRATVVLSSHDPDRVAHLATDRLVLGVA